MATVKSFNKVTGTTYVYESHKKWSKEEKKYKTIRKLIGKIDPMTGRVVPTGPRGRPRSKPLEPNSRAAKAEPLDASEIDVQALNTTIAELKIKNTLLMNEREKLSELIDGIMHFASQAKELLEHPSDDSSQ